MKRERFEQRLLRIFAEAGYQPSQLLDITPEEMVEIPGITVPNIGRFWLFRIKLWMKLMATIKR